MRVLGLSVGPVDLKCAGPFSQKASRCSGEHEHILLNHNSYLERPRHLIL